YEIDFRFQTIDELITRLSEILNPKANEVVEDLDIVIDRESATLRRRDRKTQLAEYIANVFPLHQSYQMCLQTILAKLSRQRSFSVGWQGTITQLAESSEQGDVFARVVAWVMVQSHPTVFQIHHTFVAQGTECTVYREIREGQIHSPTTSVDPSVVVLRYQGDNAPDAPAIIADFRAGITKAITLISHKIQSGH
ncbi:MAG TPA: hypothetical protein VKS19_01205, partial [Verrucomicrobiae bacterium]|nr:hypothetical protein [Verrucomicrobiae bacterium]